MHTVRTMHKIKILALTIALAVSTSITAITVTSCSQQQLASPFAANADVRTALGSAYQTVGTAYSLLATLTKHKILDAKEAKSIDSQLDAVAVALESAEELLRSGSPNAESQAAIDIAIASDKAHTIQQNLETIKSTAKGI